MMEKDTLRDFRVVAQGNNGCQAMPTGTRRTTSDQYARDPYVTRAMERVKNRVRSQCSEWIRGR